MLLFMIELCSRAVVTKISILALVLALFGHDAIAGVSTASERHFEGVRYLTLRNLEVHQQPSSDAYIVADIPRWRMIYATSVEKDGWLSITGAGSRPYPDTYTGNQGEEVGIKNGKFDFKEDRLDRDDYYPLTGFVSSTDLATLDQSSPLPLDRTSLEYLPNTWETLGVKERRFVPRTPTDYPFISAPLVLIKSKGRNYRCSGFVILKPDLVGTSGHCFDSPRDEVYVKFADAGPAVKGHIVGMNYDKSDKGPTLQDWALIKLDSLPRLPVRPLKLPSTGSWLTKGRVDVLTLGFGGDLIDLKKTLYGERGEWSVHGDQCSLPLSLLYASFYKGKTSLSTVSTTSDCILMQGDSGGPMLIWNDDTQEYEVIGIHSYGEFHFSDVRMKFDKEARAAYDRTVKQLTKQWHASPGFPPPGMYAIARKVADNIGYYYAVSGSVLNAAFIDLVLKTAGQHDATQDPLSFLNNDGIAPRSHANDPPAYANQTIASSLDNNDIYRYRSKLYNQAYPLAILDKQYQQKQTSGQTLDLAMLSQGNIPFATYVYVKAFWPAVFLRPLYFLVDESSFKKDSMIKWAARMKLPKESIDDMAQHTDRARVVIVGGDAFFIEKSTGRIFDIERNFLSFTDNELQSMRVGRRYPYDLEDPSNDRVKDLQSDVAETSSLRLSEFGAPTPLSVPGGHRIEISVVWRSILAGLNDPQQKPLIVSAIENATGVPTAINLSFANAGGDFSDNTQSKLRDIMRTLEPDTSRKIIVYCHHSECWLAYNTALRLIALGYKDVNWMRDGIDGWIEAGLPLMSVKAAQ
ncbi:trypsin-like serine protease [Pseudomonas sp. NPDC089569]|uniref:trypsin-like serine protease n=1 Tax=Pseudomonas sp. NPDC089569 TaxID=3390722 RepID=UPI003CFCF9BA